MSITIGKNISSLGALRYLSRATDQLQSQAEKLSSGQRINRASDDAAGLSVALSLNNQARIYTQGIRNINDAGSLLNVAEGALQQLSGIVIRQKELAEQAASGVYASSQRAAMNTEINQLSREYNRILRSTTFNDIQIIDGSEDAIRIQHGEGVLQSTNVELSQKLGANAGDGTFTVTSWPGVTEGAYSAAAADFNGDGLLDYISGATSSELSVWLSNGDGSFRLGSTIAETDPTYKLVTGDFNNDGKIDIGYGGSIVGGLSIRFGRGDGTFGGETTYAAGTGTIYIGATNDFNNDGVLDIAYGTTGQTGILLGNADGTFRAGISFSTPLDQGGNLAVADFNGDGKLDLATAYHGLPNGFTINFGRGDGSFSSAVTIGSNPKVSAIALGDFNDDGITDIASTEFDTGNVVTYLGNGNGTFRSGGSFASAINMNDIKSGDVNGDGISDITISLAGSAISYISRGDGTFNSGVTVSNGKMYFHLLEDFNNDNVLDVLGFGNGGSVLALGDLDATGRRNNFQSAFNLLTIFGARDALTRTTVNLEKISQELSNIGAYQSRLRAVSGAMESAKINYTAAESRIRDTDIAETTAAYTRQSILQQVGASVLAQANLQPTLALKLLQNS